ncbi:MAG TPA: ATP synthase F1 subunit epsilon [Edaphocola sp.]|nr:ATP synthase F1 subunit epsilon [Edaphocola sp.]
MQLEILTPEKQIYNGEVYGVQLPGVEGSFEILQNHAPMVAALGNGKMKIIVDKAQTKFEHFHISGGFVEVLDNKASVLLESAQDA